MTNIQTQTREQWLNQASELLLDTVIFPAIKARDLIFPILSYKVSLGTLTAKTKTLGVCFAPSASEENISEIFIAPFTNDSALICATLAHELIHALDHNENGHKGRFATLARAIDLQGNLTATTAGATLTESILDIVDAIGDIPHAKLDTNQRPKQKNRSLKVACQSCDFKFNASQKQIDAMQYHNCLVCDNGTLAQVITNQD